MSSHVCPRAADEHESLGFTEGFLGDNCFVCKNSTPKSVTRNHSFSAPGQALKEMRQSVRPEACALDSSLNFDNLTLTFDHFGGGDMSNCREICSHLYSLSLHKLSGGELPIAYVPCMLLDSKTWLD